MKKITRKIRSEQVEYLNALSAAVKQAEQARDAAIKAVLVGLVDGPAQVESIAEDGTVTLMIPEEEKEEVAG